MSDQEQTGMFFVTTPVTMSYLHVIEPKKFKRDGKEKGDPKFSGSLVFPEGHSQIAALKTKALEVAKAKWPGRDVRADYQAGKIRMPWLKGDDLIANRAEKRKNAGKNVDTQLDYLKGCIVIKASSKFRPNLAFVADKKVSEDLDATAVSVHKDKFYSGVKAFATINLVAYDKVGGDESSKDGVTAYLQSVTSLNRGKRLGGGKPQAEVFSEYVGQATEEDPTEDTDVLD
jgi:hypothetical protein